MFRSAFACCLLVLATACTSLPERKPPAFPQQIDWRLARLEGQNVPAGVDGPARLRFDTDRIVGYGGCNRIFGEYHQEGKRLTFSRMAVSRRACLAGMEYEDAFLKALEATQSWSLTKSGEGIGTLRFYDADGRLRLEMEAMEARD
jgi:heat shock protein HslJ